MSNVVVDKILLHYRAQNQTPLSEIVFADDPNANDLVKQDIVAFLMAAAIDRRGNAFRLWDMPYRLQQEWGHLDTKQIAAMDVNVLVSNSVIQSAPTRTSRHDLARTIISVASEIEHWYSGNPNRIFDGTISQIQKNLHRIYGVGCGISRMIIIQRILFF